MPVLLLVDLPIADREREDKRPQMSDLREYGRLDRHADVVLLLHRQEMYEPTEENRGRAEIIIAKQAEGPTGRMEVAFVRAFTKFEALEWRPEE